MNFYSKVLFASTLALGLPLGALGLFTPATAQDGASKDPVEDIAARFGDACFGS